MSAKPNNLPEGPSYKENNLNYPNPGPETWTEYPKIIYPKNEKGEYILDPADPLKKKYAEGTIVNSKEEEAEAIAKLWPTPSVKKGGWDKS